MLVQRETKSAVSKSTPIGSDKMKHVYADTVTIKQQGNSKIENGTLQQ